MNARKGQCNFCRAHQALTTSDPDGTIEFQEHKPGALVRYQFGQRSADFLLCRHCGIYIGAVMQSPRGRFGIVNLNAMRPVPENIPQPQHKDYGQESLEQRIARRETVWSKVRGE